MADNEVRVEDVKSVGTRISWGAVLAGAVVALALYVVLTTLGAAIGFSVGRDLSVRTLANGGLVWAILTVGLSLFAGGWVVSQLTAGETKCESMVHGVILWGTVFAVMLGMVGMGIRSGFGAMLNIAYAGDRMAERGDDASLRELGFSDKDINEGRERRAMATAKEWGFTQEQIDKAREARDAAKSKVADTVATSDADSIRRGVAMTTWGAVFGMILSMGAAIAGALVGAGPSFRLLWAGRPPLQRVPADRHYASQI